MTFLAIIHALKHLPGRHEQPDHASKRIAKNKVTAIFGRNLHIVHASDGEGIAEYLADLDKIPQPLLEKARAFGMHVWIGDVGGTSLDKNQFLKGQKPGGWPPGSTFDDVGAWYNAANKAVTLGRHKHRATSKSVAIHEFAHGLDKLMGLTTKSELKQHHINLYAKLPAYLQQGGPGHPIGMGEFVAESIAHMLVDRDSAIKTYSKDYIEYLHKELGI